VVDGKGPLTGMDKGVTDDDESRAIMVTEARSMEPWPPTQS
jgi:hypothetical protein